MSTFARMDKLWKKNGEFVDYMSEQVRLKEVKRYDERIAALQAAKTILESQPAKRLATREFKTAEKLCRSHGWTEEDADYFFEDFCRRKPAARASVSRVASGLSQLSQAFMLA